MTLLSSRPRPRTSTGGDLDRLLATWRPALDAMLTNVFVAAPDLTLVYMNPTAYSTMRAIESHVVEAFGVGVDAMVGGSIHRFHRDPQRVERTIDHGSGLPHTASFSFGPVTLDTKIAVGHCDGEVACYLVTWDDVSMLTDATKGIETVDENLSAVAGAVEQLRSSVELIARSAADASRVARDGTALTDASDAAVRLLGEQSQAISNSVESITSVAAQTNMLALNATIEAARAGEAGRGFAVVANEVKELARFTAQAAGSIEDQVAAMATATAEVMAKMSELRTMIATISENQDNVAGAVEEQSAAASEIARRAAEAAEYSTRLRHVLG